MPDDRLVRTQADVAKKFGIHVDRVTYNRLGKYVASHVPGVTWGKPGRTYDGVLLFVPRHHAVLMGDLFRQLADALNSPDPRKSLTVWRKTVRAHAALIRTARDRRQDEIERRAIEAAQKDRTKRRNPTIRCVIPEPDDIETSPI